VPCPASSTTWGCVAYGQSRVGAPCAGDWLDACGPADLLPQHAGRADHCRRDPFVGRWPTEEGVGRPGPVLAAVQLQRPAHRRLVTTAQPPLSKLRPPGDLQWPVRVAEYVGCGMEAYEIMSPAPRTPE
jgi:hypothetical protein